MSAGVRVVPITADDLDVLVELCREHAVYERAVFVEDGQVERWRCDPQTLKFDRSTHRYDMRWFVLGG